MECLLNCCDCKKCNVIKNTSTGEYLLRCFKYQESELTFDGLAQKVKESQAQLIKKEGEQ